MCISREINSLVAFSRLVLASCSMGIVEWIPLAVVIAYISTVYYFSTGYYISTG